jgi:phosphatidate cytidylyltransferase
MSSLRTRIISAIVAIIIILSLIYFMQANGLKLLVLFAVLAGTRELNRVLFVESPQTFHAPLFYFFNLIIYTLSCWRPIYSGLIFSFFFVCFCVVSISVGRKNSNLNEISTVQAKAALGFFYVGLLPAFANHILDLPSGMFWFITLLCVVFAGDIGAFAVGMAFGQKKIMPNISPKKTLEGALGGLIFSLIAGLLCSYFFPQIPKIQFSLLMVATGVIAQFGDYFESLLKRVANVKDSGGLMPGHGGVLDRIDGVLFACPIFLLGAIILEKLI